MTETLTIKMIQTYNMSQKWHAIGFCS